MRYTLQLLPDALLLLALLRMTFVGLAGQRRAMFVFLLAWLIYSFLLLFLGQIWPVSARSYVLWFFLLSIPAWLCATPALWIASRRLSTWHAIFILLILWIAAQGSRLALLNASMSWTAKLLVINCWIAGIAGAIFFFASVRAESPDLYLWRCTGIFLLLFGFGYLLIGMVRPGPWAQAVFVIAGAAVWFALAWLIGPRPEHLVNPEKLATVSSFRPGVAVARERNA